MLALCAEAAVRLRRERPQWLNHERVTLGIDRNGGLGDVLIVRDARLGKAMEPLPRSRAGLVPKKR